MPRENSQCRKWEKERRDRLNDAFTKVAKLLPCYDPSLKICKMEILNKAGSTIEELQDKMKKMMSSDSAKKTETEDLIKKLQDRVKKLLVRNEQLSNLLRDAGISVPSACGTIKKFKKVYKWSKKITPEQAKLLQKKEMEKENMCSNSPQGKKKKVQETKANIVRRQSNIQKRVLTRRRSKKNPSSNCFILMSQPSSILQNNLNQRYYLITPQVYSNIQKSCSKSGTTSGIFPKTLTANSRQPKNTIGNNISPVINSGTLVLANGTVMNLVPQYQPFIPPTLPNLLVNPTTMPKNCKTPLNNCIKKNTPKSIFQTTNNNRSAPILIRPKKYCLTKTTQVNKVPIPALTSRYANNSDLLLKTSTTVKQNEDKSKKLELKKLPNVTKSNEASKETSNKRKIDNVDCNVQKKRKETCKTDLESGNINCDNPNPEVTGNPIHDDTVNNENINKENQVIEELPVTDKGKEKDVLIENVTQKVIVAAEVDLSKEINDPEVDGKVHETLHQPTSSCQETLTVSTAALTCTATITTTHDVIKSLDLNLSHSELSNDLFASLQVPSGCQNPESTSPTAAFLLAFPLVSSGVKITEVIEEENSDSQRGTPTLLQIGTMETSKTTQSHTDTITSSFLNLDNFSFLPSKDVSNNFYNNYSSNVTKPDKLTLNTASKTETNAGKSIYVNVKSPTLPNCVSQPVKDNYNIFETKPVSTKNVNSVSSEKKIEQVKVNFISQNNTGSKPSLHYAPPKTHIQKTCEEKLPYYPPTYTTSTCNFNYATRNETTKSCTNSYVNIGRSYTNPLYTNCNTYNYNYHSDSNFNQNYYKNIPRNESKSYYPLNYENYTEYRKNDTNTYPGYYESTYGKDSKNYNTNKTKTPNKLPVNWMTTPDTRLQNTECLLNSFSKGDFTQTYPFSSYVTSSSTYFTSTSTDTTNISCIMEAKKSLDLPPISLNSHQKSDVEEKQFSWSPTKLPHFLDHPHNLVTSTLPMLVGDLALGNTLPFTEQKHTKDNKDVKRHKGNGYENQNNFLSVSQLVDHTKSDHGSAKITARRNSGNRSKSVVQQKPKKVNKDSKSCGFNNEKISGNYNALGSVEMFNEQKTRNVTKNTPSSYSAEALIGNQVSAEPDHKRYPPSSSKSLGTSSFLAENIISYFPPVELAQDSYMSQGQNYQANNFSHNICSSHNNTYSSNSFIYAPSTITSTYLPTTNFDVQHDYLPDNFMSNAIVKEKNCSVKSFNNRQLPNKDEKNSHSSICQNNFKKSKKRPTGDTSNTLANFEFPFISLPGSNNSPILPDDFHCHTNFLPPTTPFSCKNSLYPKQNDLGTNPILPLSSISRTNAQHPEISPINSAGTSLTNFNLSTIFPEINKGSMTEIFPEVRSKQSIHPKNCTSSSQVPYNTEPKFSYSS